MITYSGVFVISQCKEDISDCKGLRDIAMANNFGQNSQKYHKNGHNFSCVHHIHAEIGFEIGFVLSGNSSDSTVHKGQRGVTMATNFGTKIAINAYIYAFLLQISGMRLLITGGFRRWPIQRRHF